MVSRPWRVRLAGGAAMLMLLLVPAVATAAPLRRPAPITVVLAPRSSAALSAYARAVADPGSPDYRRYLSTAEFARRFGASAATVARVRLELRARGLSAGALSANHLSIRAALAPRAARRTLARIGRLAGGALTGVQAIEGLDPAPGPHPLLVRPQARRGALRVQPHVVTGGPQPCAAARNTANSYGGYTADQIASAYGLSAAYRNRDLGAGVTVAVYELEPVDPADLAAFQSCYQTNVPISYVRVDGGAGSGEGSGESALDIENVLGYVPGAHVLVYQGPNSNSGAPGSGPYDVYSTIINQDRAQVITVSWGECESDLGLGSARAENTLFEQAAIEGQTIVAAGGDSGSEDCQAASGNAQTSVDDPASQPYVLGVGGTTLSSLGPRPSEHVWNNGGTPAAITQAGAGGGGVSRFWGMPAAQLNAASGLGVRSGAPNGATCAQPGGWCREVPDVSADADPATGYEIYWNGSGADPIDPRGWQTIGGTSGASPVWASLIALADASPGCAGAPVGLALPALYRSAGADYGGAFNDVRSGNNDFTGTNSGQYAAGPGYDLASGLGTPNATSLLGQLCASALRLLPIGAQRSARGGAIAPLRIPHSDAASGRPVLRVGGLPPGLHFSAAGARISGTPHRSGVYHVVITASDTDGARARQAFSWTVGNPTRLLDVVLTGLSARHPQLAFTVAAGRRSPGLRRLSIALPSELRLRSTRSIVLSASGHRLRFSARHAGRQLTLTLGQVQSRVQVRLGPRAVARGAGGGAHPARLTVRALDSASAISFLQAGIARR